MIEFKTGNILTEDAEALVNTVNCVGFMGRGIALQFKKAFPDNFKSYSAACKRNEVQPGRMIVYETGQLAHPRYIINFPTKRHWRGKSRMEDIDAGLAALAEAIRSHNIQSIAVPPLGSGLGGLDWPEVRPRIKKMLEQFGELKAIVFEPTDSLSDAKVNLSTDVPAMTAGRAALIGLMDRYIKGLLDPFITLLEVHKLMYFMQVAGEPLQLNYNKGIYGPYAENLRHVLNAIEGHLVSGYADGGDNPDKQLNLIPGALEDANEFLQKQEQTRNRFERVSELVEGFESSFGLELLSTVHWVIEKELANNMSDVVERVYAWNERKKRFSRYQVELAVEVLSRRGWIENTAALNPA